MILSRLDEIEAFDADDVIKRMHINDLIENTGDNLRSNRIRLNSNEFIQVSFFQCTIIRPQLSSQSQLSARVRIG